LSLLSFGCLLNRLGFSIVAVGAAVFIYRLIRREEVELIAAHGRSYEKYLKAVPTLRPAAHPQVARGGSVPNWRDGFVGGAYLWLLAASLLVLSASLKESLIYATLVVAFAAKLIAVRLAGRPTKAAT
jgi:protein-S-isoprenylcysteine O-methyltransferase Ste14